MEDGGLVLASCAVVLGCPGAVVAGEGDQVGIVAGVLIRCVVDGEGGQAGGVAVGDGVDHGCGSVDSEALIGVGDQTGDR